MIQEQVPIGTVKRDISELVNRVAFGSERIVLTSRGKPKAALVSLEDLEKLQQNETAKRQQEWDELITKRNQLNERILKRRNGKPIDPAMLQAIIHDDREDHAAESDDIIQMILGNDDRS